MRLLESEAAPERRGGGTMTSMLVHAALIAGAVVATTRGGPPEPRIIEVLDTLVYVAPPPDLPRQATGTTGATGSATTATGLVLVAPTTVADGLPPIDVAVDVSVGTQPDVTLGRPGGGTEGGFGGPPGGGYGAPDASGTWDAHTVEVPVVPDARNPSPIYPEMLRTAGITGRVVAEFIVDSTGRVRAGSLGIVEETHALFAASVRRTVPSLRFTPARVRGQRVAQRVRVPFEFEMGR